MTKSLSEQPFFREIADIAPVMIWIAGLDKLCSYFNRTWLEFTGRDLENEIGNGWADGVHPEDFQQCLEIYHKSFDARTPFTMEYRLRRQDGVYRWILDNGKPIYSSSGEFLGYAGSCIDISDQKEALLSLEKSEERYRIVMDVISEGIWDFNFEKDEQYISPSYLSSLGYERADIEPDVSVKLTELIHPDDREKTLNAIITGMESEGAFDVEFRQRAKAGDYRWMRSRGRVLYRDTNGRPVRVVGSHSDVDARKRAEIALQQSEARAKSQHDELEWIYINAPVGLCIFDREMRYQRINQRLADFVNLSIEDHIGKSIDEIIPDLARKVRNEAQKVLLTGKPSMHHEVTGPLPDSKDRIRTFSFSCYPIFNAQHVISGYGYVVEDITEQKQLEKQLQKLNAELEFKINRRTRELAEVNAALTRLSRTDTLTGLHNRLAANERLREEHSRLHRTKQNYAILIADIDHFKHINDDYGHLIGDDVLHFIAEIFSKNLRVHDFIARYGGEEFIFLLPSTNIEQALIAAEKIRKAVAESPHPVAGTVTVSIGVAEASPDQANENLVIQEADQRLYEAKNHGRNRVVGLTCET